MSWAVDRDHVRQERQAEMRGQMLDAYQEAVALALRLEDLPRWRWRLRTRLENRYRLCCAAADEIRTLLGGTPDAPGLDTIIQEQMEELA